MNERSKHEDILRQALQRILSLAQQPGAENQTPGWLAAIAAQAGWALAELARLDDAPGDAHDDGRHWTG